MVYGCKYTLPKIFRDYFVFNIDIHSFNTRFTNNLYLVRVSTTYGQQAIKFKYPTLWNSLPLSIRNLALIEFKCKLKDYLLADVN